jgi:hypothetical protein
VFFAADGLVAFLLFALWVYCIFDVISTDAALCRNLTKMLWLVIVIFLPDIGSLCWLLLGRPEKAGWRPGDTESRPAPRRRVSSPDDDEAFLSGLSPIVRDREEQAKRRMLEAQRRRLEEELKKLGPEDPEGGQFD